LQIFKKGLPYCIFSRLEDVTVIRITIARTSGVSRILFQVVQQIQLRTENREKRDRGA